MVKVIGWGEEEDDGETKKFWLVQTYFGNSWGQEGTARIEIENEDSIVS